MTRLTRQSGFSTETDAIPTQYRRDTDVIPTLVFGLIRACYWRCANRSMTRTNSELIPGSDSA